MNCAHFEDPVSHTFAGAVEASWPLTQEVAGLSPFTVMTNIFVTEFTEAFRKNSIELLFDHPVIDSHLFLELHGMVAHSFPLYCMLVWTYF